MQTSQDTTQDTIQSLEVQLAEARDMAFRMMTFSSEMGQINQFLSRSFGAESYQVLANLLLEHLSAAGLEGSLAIHDGHGRVFFSLRKDDSEMEESLIVEHHNTGRVVDLGGRLLVNYPLCSLLIYNVPQDEDTLGSLRDNLALLMSGVEARVRSLALEMRAEEGRRAKDEFFALMSHELRTPLNPIIGYASRLIPRLKEAVSPKDMNALESIKENGEHLLRQINDILAFVRLKNGDIRLQPKASKVGQEMLLAAQEVEPMLQKHSVELDVNVPKDELLFYGDPTRLNDIFIGLLSNAIKYSPRGKVLFQAGIEAHNGGEQLVILVKDSGIGIAPEYHEKIFQHFTDRNTPISTRTMSIGVSMFVIRELVRLHGGRIELDSDVGKGSTFRIILPGIGVSLVDASTAAE